MSVGLQGIELVFRWISRVRSNWSGHYDYPKKERRKHRNGRYIWYWSFVKGIKSVKCLGWNCKFNVKRKHSLCWLDLFFGWCLDQSIRRFSNQQLYNVLIKIHTCFNENIMVMWAHVFWVTYKWNLFSSPIERPSKNDKYAMHYGCLDNFFFLTHRVNREFLKEQEIYFII